MGILGWSKAFKFKKTKSVDPETFHYYRLGGVDHFMTKCNVGLAVGYFYYKSRFNCWISYELGTLVKVSDSKKVAYIKTRNV
ncbi:hypothetical protein Bca4012_094178 [Brassica carinata]